MKCPMCRGPGGMLGELGNLRHFRCRNCGMDFSKRIKSTRAAPAPRAAALPAPAPAPRKPSRSSGSGRVNPLLTREGTVVRFEPTAASAMLYSHAPPAGTLGTTVSMSLPGAGRKVYIRGPGGGLVYVGWEGYGTQGVSPMDLEVVSAKSSKPRQNPGRGDYGIDASEFKIGEHVELSPHLDLWMRGARYGTVRGFSRDKRRVKVELDALRGKTQLFSPQDLAHRGPATRANPGAKPKRGRADPTTRMIQHGMCDAWLCTNIAQYETRGERGEARRLCKKCLRIVAQAEANKASGCARTPPT